MQYAAHVAENDEAFAMRQSIGQGKTLKLLQAERAELDAHNSALECESRILGKEIALFKQNMMLSSW